MTVDTAQIYDSRPSTCRSWCCGWLLGVIEGDERRRPDRLGLLFNREELAGKPITVAYEVWPGAGKEPNNVYLLRKMSQKAPIVLRAYETRKCAVITPDRKKQRSMCASIQAEWCNNRGTAWSECGYFTQRVLDSAAAVTQPGSDQTDSAIKFWVAITP